MILWIPSNSEYFVVLWSFKEIILSHIKTMAKEYPPPWQEN